MRRKEFDMRIILDTDKKTITVPWNYSDKLAGMNKILEEAGAPKLEFSKYIDDIWKYSRKNSDTQVKTAQKPAKKGQQATNVGVNFVNTVSEQK